MNGRSRGIALKHLIKYRKYLGLFLLITALNALSVNAYAKYYPDNRDNVYVRLNTKEKVLALTFDDGPHPTKTPQILDVLEKYGVKATFFMIGENVRLYPEVARKVAESGHEIGNHTYDHRSLYNMNDDEIKEQVRSCKEEIYSVTGKTAKLFRPPEGFMNDKIAFSMKDLGYNVILWGVDTYDWKGKSSFDIVKTVTDNTSGGDIILMHDYISKKSNTSKALDVIIPLLIERGYRFVCVSEFLC